MSKLETTLLNGGVAVLRTDTIYGLVARALDEAAVERVYKIKGRNDAKPPIVLIACWDQLFDPVASMHKTFLRHVWPGPNSVIIPSVSAPRWLARGTGAVAYRLPNNPELVALLKKTGPLIAPSANPEGLPPAINVNQARDYFGDAVDAYVDGGEVKSTNPSALFRLSDNHQPEQLR